MGFSSQTPAYLGRKTRIGKKGEEIKTTARASGGCARTVYPASGGEPGQATLYIGALH